MKSKKLLEKALLARRKGVIHLIVFLIIEFIIKIGGIMFIFFVIGDFLLDYKRMQAVGTVEAIRESAIFSFFIVIIPAIIGGIFIEILHRRHR